jgi:disulfide bond formation protein DsbB
MPPDLIRRLSPRQLNALGFFACAALLAYAYYAQSVLRVEPCPLCIFQRIGVAATGVLFLAAALHGPGRAGSRAYGALLLLAVAATIFVAGRHVWIQHLPEGAVPACGATLGYMLEVFPVGDVIRKVLTGSGECHQVNWSFLGLSMPVWVLLAAAALGALAGYANLQHGREQARGLNRP